MMDSADNLEKDVKSKDHGLSAFRTELQKEEKAWNKTTQWNPNGTPELS